MTSGHRLLVVSAHFPPDFVSGGTLVPDREARRLAARDWDVSVYAGSLAPDRVPLETWQEDVGGLSVRWIAIAPFTGWGDRRNFDNPAVVADFRRHLATVRPDVVHLHSLQTMGGGMVRAAKEAGARTVVTMHDFWWSCARQFLVDRNWVPCSLVVDAGACQCEVDRAWLDERNAWLRDELVHADLVLAPSPVAARVLAANGVPADRLRVDENGLDALPAGGPRPAHTGPVRFRYAGGHNRMKGSVVLAEAARLLAERRPDGWTLVVHADSAAYAIEVTGSVPETVTVRPPFVPERLDDVLADTDVLVIPSVMRESHSLLTREALLRGVPVISSDSLGPEDAIESGLNGRIVPTGDASALAAAMESVVDDSGCLTTWAATAVQVRVRGVDEQIEGLDSMLRALVASPPVVPAPSPIRRVLFVVGIDGAPLRYRAHLPAEALALVGVDSEMRHYRDPEVPALAGQADAVVVYRVPATVQVLHLLERLRRARPQVPVLFDVDDLIFDPELADEIPALKVLPAEEAALWLQGVHRYRTTMEACDGFVGSTELLCRHATEVTGLTAYRFANGVGRLLAARSDAALRRPRRPGPLRVGYFSGTTTHDRDWAQVEPAVLDVLGRVADVELWLGGHLNPSAAVDQLGDRVHRIPMQEWHALPELLRDLDVNLAPLEPLGRFNEAKSAIKWLEAALCGTPTIASPTQPFEEVVRHGANGFLATGVHEWTAALEALLTDEVLRASVGARARRDALLTLSPHLQATRYLEVLEAARLAVAAGRPDRSDRFTAVALDEPAEPSPLQPYTDHPVALPVPADAAPVPRSRRALRALRRRAGSVRRTARAEGLLTASAQVGRGVARDARRLAGVVSRRLRGGQR